MAVVSAPALPPFCTLGLSISSPDVPDQLDLNGFDGGL
jgi:hypothetical protein